MADQAINEMISAFAAGCMDKENFLHFHKYVKSKGELPYKGLGKLQTLTSMLPAILEQETPPPALKNKLARNLISMQDEIKEKIKIEKQKTLEMSGSSERVQSGGGNQTSKEDYMAAEKTDKKQTGNGYSLQNNKLFPDNMAVQTESRSQVPLWIVVTILFFALCGLAYYTFTNFKEMKETTAKTENNLAVVKSELRGANEFINRNAALIEFFNNENVWIVQIEGSDPSLKISGKLFIALSEKEALLQVNNLPSQTPETAYQLWADIKGRTVSIGSFFVEPGSRFVKLTNIPDIVKDEVMQFKITGEPRGGSALPTGITYASSQGNKAAAKPARKR